MRSLPLVNHTPPNHPHTSILTFYMNIFLFYSNIWTAASRTITLDLYPEGGGEVTPLYGLYGDLPLDRVWFS